MSLGSSYPVSLGDGASRPCPFCNSRNLKLDKHTALAKWWVICIDCSAWGPIVAGEAGAAISAWNRRIATDTIPCEFEKDHRDAWDASVFDLEASS